MPVINPRRGTEVVRKSEIGTQWKEARLGLRIWEPQLPDGF